MLQLYIFRISVVKYDNNCPQGEHSHCNDQLMDISEMSNKKSYREVRQYQTGYHLVRFYFVTACYNSYTETVLQDLEKEPHPDVIIMNSCLWDVSRLVAPVVSMYLYCLQTCGQLQYTNSSYIPITHTNSNYTSKIPITIPKYQFQLSIPHKNNSV